MWSSRSAAVSMLYVEFNEKTAHAGLEPWKGRSALDAVEQFCHGVNLMRELHTIFHFVKESRPTRLNEKIPQINHICPSLFTRL